LPLLPPRSIAKAFINHLYGEKTNIYHLTFYSH
jgi:hypothetical protein